MSSKRDRASDGAGGPSSAGLLFRVITAEGTQTFPLPVSGTVVIGRSSECDVCIDDRSVSRRHASLHVDGCVQLEDHGGANGTRVRGSALKSGAREHVFPGDVVKIGNVRCELGGTMPEASARRAGEIVVEHSTAKRMPVPTLTERPNDLPDDLRNELNVSERQRIVAALEKCGGDQTRAAALLGISRRALVATLERDDVPRPRRTR